MDTSTLFGALLVAGSGFSMGAIAWTLKAQRRFQVEHWLLVAMFTGLVIIPWSATLLVFPNAFAAYREVGMKTLLLANLFAFGWGIANVLCLLCFVRIGVGLTGGILGGLGLSLGVITPMIFKASGLFEDAPDLGSPAGLTVLVGVVFMLGGVVLVSWAGFGRDRALKAQQQQSGAGGGFLGGLIMAIIAGVLSTGPNFVFAYSQDPIVSRITTVKPASEISVRIAGSSKNVRRLAGSYLVSESGELLLPEPVGPVKVAGMEVVQAGGEIANRLKAIHLFLAPQVKLVAGVSGSIAAGETVKLKLAESAPSQLCRVDQDGNIALDGIGAVNVAGKSVLEVREAIAAKAQAVELLRAASVSVDTRNLLAPFPVWAVGMMAGALVNLLFPLYLMRRNRSGHLLLTSWRELPFPLIGGLQFIAAILVLGVGSLKLGALGASVGWGIYQAMQVLGGQAVGFLSGEWRGVHGRPRTQMYLAILVIIVAACIVAFGNTQPKI